MSLAIKSFQNQDALQVSQLEKKRQWISMMCQVKQIAYFQILNSWI